MSDKTHQDVLGESHLPDDLWTPTEGENYGLDGYPDMDYGAGVLFGDVGVSETVPRMDEGVLASLVDAAPDGQVFAPLGDLGDMVKEATLPDLSWLEVDEQDLSRLPENPVAKGIPELEEAWGVDRRTDGVNLVPNVDIEKAAYEQSLEAGEVGPVRTRGQLLNIVRKAMRRSAAGVPFKDVLAEVKAVLGGDLPLIAPHLKLIRQGHGLAGKVFVHADAYPGCANGTWTETLKKTAAKAKYVVAGAGCANCVHNDCGSCSVLKKRIVASVPWDKALEQYRPGMEASGRKVASGDPKAVLRAAFAQDPQGMGMVQGHKPVHISPSERISAEDAQLEVQAAKAEQRVYTPEDKQAARKLHVARIRVARWSQQGLLPKSVAQRIVAQDTAAQVLKSAVSIIVAVRGASVYSGMVNDTRVPDMAEEEAWKRLGAVAPLPEIKITREQVHKQITRWAQTGLLDKPTVQKLAASTAEPRDVLRSAAILASPVATSDYSGAVNNMHGTEVSQQHAWDMLRKAEQDAARITAALVSELEKREFQASREGKFLRNVQTKVASIEATIGRGLRGTPLLRLLRRAFTEDEIPLATPLLKPLLERTGALKEEVREIQDYRGAGIQRKASVSMDEAMNILLAAPNASNQKSQAMVRQLEQREFQASRAGKHMAMVQAKVAKIEEAIGRGLVGKNLLRLIRKTIRPDDHDIAIPLLDPVLQRTGALEKEVKTVHDYSGVENKRASEDIPTADAWKQLFTAKDAAKTKEVQIKEARDSKVAVTIQRKVVQIKEAIERGARGQALRKIIARTFLKAERQQATQLLRPLLEKTGALKESDAQEYQGTRYERAVGRKAEVTPLPKEVRGVVRWARQKMSEGNAGNQLDELLNMRFSPRVLAAAQQAVQEAREAHEGLAGHLYVDASAYATERGTKGCESGADQHRANPLKAVLQMDRCATCSLRNAGSDGNPRCQTYKKTLIAALTKEEARTIQANNIRMANAPDQEVTASLFGNRFDQQEFRLGSGEMDNISVGDSPDVEKLGGFLFGGLLISED